jgi:chromosome segregation ATPase
MMVVSAGAVDSLGQLKELLEIASDPKKVSKALGELQAAADETRKLLEEKSKIEMEATAKLKKVEDGRAEYEDKMAKLRSLDAEMKVKHEVYESNSSELKDREQKLASGLKALAVKEAAFSSEVERHEAHMKAQGEEAAKEIADAKALKNAYEAKLAKLKQAMG